MCEKMLVLMKGQKTIQVVKARTVAIYPQKLLLVPPHSHSGRVKNQMIIILRFRS